MSKKPTTTDGNELNGDEILSSQPPASLSPEAHSPDEEEIESAPDSQVRRIRAEVAAKTGEETADSPTPEPAGATTAPAIHQKPAASKPKKSSEPVLPPELLPYKEQMREWVSAHEDFLQYFFNIRGEKFKIVYGDWFYYSPKKNQICLGVKAFKEAVEKHKDELESGAMSMDQIFFALLHEIAHFKTTLENDKAGKLNLLEHFKYMAGKKIESADTPGKFVGLGGTYANFYNIMEDAIVNYMVSNTIQFQSPRAKKEILDLYAEKFFQLFKKVAKGEGDYAMLPDPKTGNPRPQKTEKGAGDLCLLKAADYEKGFDTSELADMDKLTSQFLTFFIKTQMGVMKAEDIYDGEEFKNGKYKVPAPVAAVFREPLPKLYKRLLTAVMQKYASEPEKLKRYTDFMASAQSVPVYSKGAKGVSITDYDVVHNVFPPHALKAKNVVGEAWNSFIINLEKLGIKDARRLTLIEIFNKFKELDFGKKDRTEIPFARSYTQRTAIMRRAIEPIFSLFCILDDSFDLKLPPESQQHGEPQEGEEGEPQEGEEGEPQEGDEGEPQEGEPPEEDLNAPWKEGVEVEERGTGRKGIIKKVYTDGDGNVTSVDVAYFEDVKTAMATLINGRDVEFTGDETNVENPVANLVIIRKKQPSNEQGKKQKPKKIKYKNLDDDSPKDEPKKEEKDEESEESAEEDDESNESDESGEESGSKKKTPANPDDVRKIFGDMIDALEESLEEDERKENADAFKKTSETADYRDKQNKIKKNKKLEDALKKHREAGSKSTGAKKETPSEDHAQADAALVAMYNELEKKIAPFAEKMAKSWREVVRNIARVVSIEKDKYYTRGKIDIKKAQRYLPEAEYGVDMDEKRIKQLWVERIRTELRPKMLRLHLVVDNSGSMSDNIEQIRMAIMLLNSSLRSLRSQFKDELRAVLGDSYTPDMDLVCDVQITSFGSGSRLVKPFAVKNFKFLHAHPREISILPSPDRDQEQVATIAAFGKIDCGEDNTYDADFWPALIDEYERSPELKRAIREGKLTDVVLQISDGAIQGTEIAEAAIRRLKEGGIRLGGFAIGGEGALNALAKRHGADKVIPADNASQIVEKFAGFLQTVVMEEVQKPIISSITGSQKDKKTI